MKPEFCDKIKEIAAKDHRYHADAYDFVMQALWFTQRKLKREGHISGKELLGGVREFVLEQYGPMAKTVFEYWGIHKTDDFGEIVFNMIEAGLMRKTDEDKLDDFKGVYKFDKAFNVFNSNSIKI